MSLHALVPPYVWLGIILTHLSVFQNVVYWPSVLRSSGNLLNVHIVGP